MGALKNLEFSAAELAEIDGYATEANINLWARSAERGSSMAMSTEAGRWRDSTG